MQELPAFISDMERLSRDIGNDLTKPLEDSKVPIAEGIAGRFITTTGPDNRPWPRRVFPEEHPLLDKSGSLKNAAIGKGAGHVERIENQNELVWGVEKSGPGGLPGAAVHQFGATIVPVRKQWLKYTAGGKVRFSKKSVIPPRPYLGFPEYVVYRIEKIFVEHLQGLAAREVA